jgi:chromosome segregation ATPase
MANLPGEHDSHSQKTPEGPLENTKVTAHSKLARVEPQNHDPQELGDKNVTTETQPNSPILSGETELRNSTDTTHSIEKPPQTRTDELHTPTDEPHTRTDELHTRTDELHTPTAQSQIHTDELYTLTDELYTLTDELCTLTDELPTPTDELHARTKDLYTRTGELKENNLVFHEKLQITGMLSSQFDSKQKEIETPQNQMIKALEQDASYSDKFKENVKKLKFFANEANEELEKLETENSELFDDMDWPFDG